MSHPWAGMKQMMSHFYGCHFIFGQFLGGPSETSIEAESFTLLLFLVGVAGGDWREILPVEKRRGGGGHKRNCYIPRLSLN